MIRLLYACPLSKWEHTLDFTCCVLRSQERMLGLIREKKESGEEQTEEAAKGILKRKKVSSWGWSKEKSKVSREAFNTNLSISHPPPSSLQLF